MLLYVYSFGVDRSLLISGVTLQLVLTKNDPTTMAENVGQSKTTVLGTPHAGN